MKRYKLTREEVNELFLIYLEMKKECYPRRNETKEFDDPTGRITIDIDTIENYIRKNCKDYNGEDA